MKVSLSQIMALAEELFNEQGQLKGSDFDADKKGPVGLLLFDNGKCLGVFTKVDLDEEISDNGKENHERLEMEARCKQTRNEFRKYVKSLDRAIFQDVAKALGSEQLHKLHDIIEDNITDINAMKEAIETYRKTANEVIMKKVVSLKNQMV